MRSWKGNVGVKVEPVNGREGVIKYKSNVRVGDRLYWQRSEVMNQDMLPAVVTVVADYPFCILVNTGHYITSISKAAIFCSKDNEVLYIISSNNNRKIA